MLASNPASMVNQKHADWNLEGSVRSRGKGQTRALFVACDFIEAGLNEAAELWAL